MLEVNMEACENTSTARRLNNILSIHIKRISAYKWRWGRPIGSFVIFSWHHDPALFRIGAPLTSEMHPESKDMYGSK